MIHQNSLSLHFDFKLVKDSLKNLLELLEVLWLSGVWVMVTTYQNYLAMQQAFDPPHGRKPTTLVAEVAQVEHDGIFRHYCIPVIDQCLVVLCYCRPWTIAEADDVLMAEVRVTGEEHHATIGKVVFHTIFVFFVKAATVESHDTNLIARANSSSLEVWRAVFQVVIGVCLRPSQTCKCTREYLFRTLQ